jgi:chromosome segregation ATPase
MENKNTPGKGSNKLILVLLILSLIGNLWQWTGKNSMEDSHTVKMDSLITARVDVEKELNETYSELNQYKGINGRLDSLLQEANAKIDEQKARISKLMSSEKNSASLNRKLKAELAELEALRDQYLEKIDQLLIENAQLKKEKEDLSTTVESLNKNLETTISTASVLKSEYMKVTAFKKRSNGKYTETLMAKRTNKMELCMSLLENKIAKAGNRTVYLRIIEPGGNVLGNRSGGSSSFKKEGTTEELLFTSSKIVEYKNEKTDLCLDWEEAERKFNPGTYLMEVYVDGNLSGTTSIKLQ